MATKFACKLSFNGRRRAGLNELFAKRIRCFNLRPSRDGALGFVCTMNDRVDGECEANEKESKGNKTNDVTNRFYRFARANRKGIF